MNKTLNLELDVSLGRQNMKVTCENIHMDININPIIEKMYV